MKKKIIYSYTHIEILLKKFNPDEWNSYCQDPKDDTKQLNVTPNVVNSVEFKKNTDIDNIKVKDLIFDNSKKTNI